MSSARTDGACSGAQGCEPGSSSERTRTAITAALKKKLKDTMGEFGVLRDKLQQEYRCAALSRPAPPCGLVCAARRRLRCHPSAWGCQHCMQHELLQQREAFDCAADARSITQL